MILPLYRALARYAAPLLRGLIAVRKLQGLEEDGRVGERMGIASQPRPAGRVIWFHAASVGEMNSVLPLAERLLDSNPGAHALVTTVTVTAAKLVAALNHPRVVHQYAPFDAPQWVGAFLDHWKPDAVIWVESEFWPNTLEATKARGIPMALVNGRLSDKSARRWKTYAAGAVAHLLSLFDVVLAQTEGDARRLAYLGAQSAVAAGNMKYARAPLPCDSSTLAELQAQMAGRPALLYASTHEGEERMAARIHKDVSMRRHGLLSFVMPRHPARGDDIAAQMAAEKLVVARRSKRDAITPQTQIYLADTLGEAGLFFRLAHAVYMGNSLGGTPGGGHNPIEPAQLGCAIVYGPHMWNFAEIDNDLRTRGAARMVHSERELEVTFDRLLADPAVMQTMGEAARGFAATQTGILDGVCAHLRSALGRAGISA
jgi:3-deoxy-D-manno-octulosonic-acid transferase